MIPRRLAVLLAVATLLAGCGAGGDAGRPKNLVGVDAGSATPSGSASPSPAVTTPAAGGATTAVELPPPPAVTTQAPATTKAARTTAAAPRTTRPAAPRTTQAAPPPPPPPPAAVYYKNCDDVRAHGAAPLLRGQPGYRAALDRDGDGVACE